MTDLAEEFYLEIAATRRFQGGKRSTGWENLVPYENEEQEWDERRGLAFQQGVSFGRWLVAYAPAHFSQGVNAFMRGEDPFIVLN